VSIAGGQRQSASPFDFDLIIVKGEVSPVYLTGILFRSSGVPLNLSGVVWAVMTMRLDPRSGEERPDIPTVDAKCYLSARDEGRYKISGIAPGIYDIYASAIPFSRILIRSGLRIFGQPPSIDGQVHLTISLGDNAAMVIRDTLSRDTPLPETTHEGG
jgi:hypothetical protein